MKAPIVVVRDLVRRFEDVEAVRGLSFDVPAGCVLGFIGANGAGKTTTMRVMSTLDAPTTGTVHVCGHDTVVEPLAVRARIGWVPDAFGAYDNVTVGEYLDFHARAWRFTGAERRRRILEVVDFTGVGDWLERQMKTLSKGMGQRLSLARALLHDPDVLLLDEPAAGLDPRARLEFKQLVRLLASEGKTLFVSSHILSELEEMCDELLFIDAGQLVHHGSADSLRSSPEDDVVVTVEVAGDPEALRQWVRLNPGVEAAGDTARGMRLKLAAADPVFVAGRLRAMVDAGLPVVEFRREQRRLEDAFVDVLDRREAARG